VSSQRENREKLSLHRAQEATDDETRPEGCEQKGSRKLPSFQTRCFIADGKGVEGRQLEGNRSWSWRAQSLITGQVFVPASADRTRTPEFNRRFVVPLLYSKVLM
jgi:hypothetical protein